MFNIQDTYEGPTATKVYFRCGCAITRTADGLIVRFTKETLCPHHQERVHVPEPFELPTRNLLTCKS